MASFWDIIVPVATENIVTNPSFETDTSDWTTGGTNTIVRTADEQQRGVYSLKCTYSNNTVLASYAVTLTAASYSVGIDVYIPAAYSGTQVTIAFANFASMTGTLTVDADMTKTDQWQRLEFTAVPNAGDLVGTLEIQETGTPGAGFIYIDGVQIEQKTTSTTYTDTTRDELDATGGEVKNLSDDLGFTISEQDGTGMPPVNNLSSPLALQPGNLFEAQTIAARRFKLIGSIVGTTPADFHDKKRGLISALDVSTVTVQERAQQRTLRYRGATEPKEISVSYDGGLERGLSKGWANEKINLGLLANDPLFYELGNSGAEISTASTFLSSGPVAKINGNWNNMGISSGNDIFSFVEDETYIYVGGNFSSINGNANMSYVARRNKLTNVWSALGTGMNGDVNDMYIATNGDIYVVGNFTNAGGVSANRIAKWDGSWNAIGTGLNSNGDCIVADSNGVVYIGGIFTSAGGVSANRIVKLTGTTYTALGTGVTVGSVSDCCVDSFDNLYITGSLTTVGGLSVNGIAMWDGSWNMLGSGFSGGSGGRGIAATVTNEIYCVGTFTSAGGITVNYAAKWNGISWNALGTGLNNNAYAIDISADGIVYIAGSFDEANDNVIPTGAVAWNGSEFTAFDIALPSNSWVSIYESNDGNLYGSGTSLGTVETPGTTNIEYYGTEKAYPVFNLTRNGGISATLYSIKNELTNADLNFSYSFQDGETLTIDTRPGKQSITSSSQGNISSALLPNSNFGTFYLMQGNDPPKENAITCFVGNNGATITATIEYKTAFISED